MDLATRLCVWPGTSGNRFALSLALLATVCYCCLVPVYIVGQVDASKALVAISPQQQQQAGPTIVLAQQASQQQASLVAASAAKQANGKVNFTDCGPKNIKDVRIYPCAGDGSVCHINLGTNVTVEADFVAKNDASSLSEVIKGIIRGREMQFPEQRSDPCRTIISPGCPIKVNKAYQYKASFEIKPYYPAIPVKVKYALVNQNGDMVACVQISAKIVDPAPTRISSARQQARAKAGKKPS